MENPQNHLEQGNLLVIFYKDFYNELYKTVIKVKLAKYWFIEEYIRREMQNIPNSQKTKRHENVVLQLK